MPNLFLYVCVFLCLCNSANSTSNESYWEKVQSWWSTITTVVSAADNFMDKYGVYEMCDEHNCPTGYSIAHNRTAPRAIPNGCGSYGVMIPATYLPVVTDCCNDHDLCYATCTKRKTYCDKRFLTCVLRVCKAVEMALGNDSSIVSSTLLKTFFRDYNTCTSLASTMEGSVKRFGCITYQESQKSQCYCKRN